MVKINCGMCNKQDVCYKKEQVKFIEYLFDAAKMFDITCPSASYIDYPEEYFDYLVKEYENERSKWE